jgi:hypothetical protein
MQRRTTEAEDAPISESGEEWTYLRKDRFVRAGTPIIGRSHPPRKGGLLLPLRYFWVDWGSIFSMTMALEPPRL